MQREADGWLARGAVNHFQIGYDAGIARDNDELLDLIRFLSSRIVLVCFNREDYTILCSLTRRNVCSSITVLFEKLRSFILFLPMLGVSRVLKSGHVRWFTRAVLAVFICICSLRREIFEWRPNLPRSGEFKDDWATNNAPRFPICSHVSQSFPLRKKRFERPRSSIVVHNILKFQSPAFPGLQLSMRYSRLGPE